MAHIDQYDLFFKPLEAIPSDGDCPAVFLNPKEDTIAYITYRPEYGQQLNLSEIVLEKPLLAFYNTRKLCTYQIPSLLS